MKDPNDTVIENLEYKSETETHRATFSSDSTRPSTAVITMVAEVTNLETDELDPLYSVIDPDALDSIFRQTLRGNHKGDTEVFFRYHGYEVAVRSYGLVEITPTE